MKWRLTVWIRKIKNHWSVCFYVYDLAKMLNFKASKRKQSYWCGEKDFCIFFKNKIFDSIFKEQLLHTCPSETCISNPCKSIWLVHYFPLQELTIALITKLFCLIIVKSIVSFTKEYPVKLLFYQYCITFKNPVIMEFSIWQILAPKSDL